MLFEFAVEPEVMTSWHNVRLLSNLFGIEHARLISKFPSKWQREVYEACDRRPDLGDVEKKRIKEKVFLLGPKLVATGRPYTPTKLWLENAESEHIRRPFRAIIATTNPRSHTFILDVDSLDESVELWNVPREGKVPRQPRAMATCVSLLFQMSRSILFVDPHFTAESRFVRPLIQFLRVACDVAQRTGRPFDRIEYHLEWKYDVGIFATNCQASVLPQVPNGCEITFFRWKRRKPGEDLHPRYVLTDLGGIRFDCGLDDGEPGETTDASLLSHALYVERWEDFQQTPTSGRSATYNLVDRIRVVGGGSVTVLP
jgi:hypothetical protein